MFFKKVKDKRTLEQLEEHYRIEKELANKLRSASAKERPLLYTTIYDEFFERVPHTSQLTRKKNPVHIKRAVDEKLKLVGWFLQKDMSFMEIGAGDCSLSINIAGYVKSVYSIDVSAEITRGITPPGNFRLIISDGLNIPVPGNSIDLAYSNQLMEHLHPEDAVIQLRNIYNALVPGGKYICITPNRFYGPHDISKYFDDIASGFHLKEYTLTELINHFKSVGFSKFLVYAGGKGTYVRFPVKAALWTEKILGIMPGKVAKVFSSFLPIKAILGINIVGFK